VPHSGRTKGPPGLGERALRDGAGVGFAGVGVTHMGGGSSGWFVNRLGGGVEGFLPGGSSGRGQIKQGRKAGGDGWAQGRAEDALRSRQEPGMQEEGTGWGLPEGAGATGAGSAARGRRAEQEVQQQRRARSVPCSRRSSLACFNDPHGEATPPGEAQSSKGEPHLTLQALLEGAQLRG